MENAYSIDRRKLDLSDQLPPKEKILRLHRSRRPELKDDEPGDISDQLDNDIDKRDHVIIMP